MSADIVAAGGVAGARPAVPETPAAKPAAEPVVLKPRPPAAKGKEASREFAENQAELVRKSKEASAQLNDVMSTFDKGIHFRVHEETHRTYVEIVNKKTNEVVRTFPPEELLDAMARLHQVIGMILDTEG